MFLQFTGFANQIIGVYQINAKRIVEAYETFAVQFSAFAVGANQNWPYVTLPAFEAQVDALVKQTGARTMGVCHLVDEEERPAWESFTMFNQGWIQDSLDYQGKTEPTRPIMPFIWGSWAPPFGPIDAPLENYDFYAPMWQAYETPGLISNFDCMRYVFSCLLLFHVRFAGPPVLTHFLVPLHLQTWNLATRVR